MLVDTDLDKDIFVYDKWARAFLLFAKVWEHEKYLRLECELDYSIFSMNLDF